MPYSPRNIRIACNHAGLTHYGGVYFFHEFLRVLQLRHFLARHLTYPRRNNRYDLSQIVLALMYPIVLGLDRLETASFFVPTVPSNISPACRASPILRLCAASYTMRL